MIFDNDDLFQKLRKQLISRILGKMETHIGYEKHSKDEKKFDSRRNTAIRSL